MAGLTLRLHLATTLYLNPDEAMHALLSFGTFGDVLRNSLLVTHPPLLILITHAVSLVSRSEFALRLVPVLAGSVFPVLTYLWLRRVAGNVAGLTAMFILSLAPNLIALSAEIRSYTLALLFLSAALLALEEAFESGRILMMALYSVLLWACILSDYSGAWFAGAAGIYALLRLRGSPAGIKAVWAAGQVIGLALYAALFRLQIRVFHETGVMLEASGWLKGSFPHGSTLLTFPVVNTPKPFAFLFASVPLGVLASVIFVFALWRLWTGKIAIDLRKSRALAVLLAVPFALGIATAYAGVLPYGRSRHTLVIQFFAAAGVAVFMQGLARRVAIAILCAALLLTPLWHWTASRDPMEIDASRNRRELMLQCLDYMRANIPPGTRIFAEAETALILAYYEGDGFPPLAAFTQGKFFDIPLGGRWRMAARDYIYTSLQEYQAALAAFRIQYGMGVHEPVWIVMGGWNTDWMPPDPAPPFTRAVRIFESTSR